MIVGHNAALNKERHDGVYDALVMCLPHIGVIWLCNTLASQGYSLSLHAANGRLGV